MTRMLKCPLCQRQSAYKTMGWAKDGRHYSQKCCSACGYEGKRSYSSLEMSNLLRERLSAG